MEDVLLDLHRQVVGLSALSTVATRIFGRLFSRLFE